MLVESWRANPDLVNLHEITREGYAAMRAGNLALLGDESSDQSELARASIAEILLAQDSTAIMHFEDPGEDETAPGVMMAVNYENGHSEGEGLIVIQHPLLPDEGQWMIYHFPGVTNRTFYRRSDFLGKQYRFEKVPTNPEKIKNYRFHIGKPHEAITSFECAGYSFSDESLPAEVAEEFREYRESQRMEWTGFGDLGGSLIF